jgi:glycosyltransferase involved in cell wall biosynthesis
MRIAALVESPHHVCCRYRLRAFQQELARGGHTLELRILPTTWYGKFCIGSDLGDFDAVILQRRLLPGWQLRLLRRSVQRLIFDFDDAVFGRDSYASRGFESPRRWRRFAGIVRCSDAIVAGNDWLREQALKAEPLSPVYVIPTCVDPSVYPRSLHHDADGQVRMVWIGSHSTIRSLERIRPILNSLGNEIPNLRLRLICDRSIRFESLSVEDYPWDPLTESVAIASGDIGISWAPDDQWSRGKCGLKVLQYMAAGLPVIANPVGVQATMIEHNENGLLAETESDWIAAVKRLAHDRNLRLRMGAAGRARVEKEFSVVAGGKSWRQVLDAMQRTRRLAG